MKRKLSILALALCCLLVLSGCCFHKEWYAATCTAPKTCVECGETEGEALGHVWVDATCTAPKTCSTCRLTEGEALGHAWVDATTEAPKTCTTCAATEGERIVTDPRFTTAATKDLYGKWVAPLSLSSDMLGVEGFDGTLEMEVSIAFTNDGTMNLGYSITNNEEFMASFQTYLENTMIAEFEAQGMTREAVDSAMMAQYGMDISAFCAAVAESMNLSAAFESMSINGVYYVEGGRIFTGISWDTELSGSDFTLNGDTFTMVEEINDLTEQPLVFTRVAE